MISDNLVNGDGLNLETNNNSSTMHSSVMSKLAAFNSISSIPHSQLKTLMRTISIDLDDPIRKTLWLELALRNNGSKGTDDYDDQLSKLSINKLPTFVEPQNARFFALNPKTRRQVASILWNLYQSYPQMTFVPLLYPLVSLFLHFHCPQDVYRSIVALLSSKHHRFISINRSDRSIDGFILVKLTNKFGIVKRNKLALSARAKLKNNQLDTAFADWIQWIFACLPFHFCVRIVDCYLVEGEKFLYRVALVLAQLFEKQHGTDLTLERMRDFCQNLSSLLTPSQLIAAAVKLTRLSRKDIDSARAKAQKLSEQFLIPKSPSLNRNGNDCAIGVGQSLTTFVDILSPKEFVLSDRIAPRKFKSSIVSWNQLDILWEWIPERIYVMEPTVIFCSDVNGNSLQTFFSLCGDNEPTILLVKTFNNEIFGAYCSAAWSRRFEQSHKVGQFFGNGETFLFKLQPSVAKYDWVGKKLKATQLSSSRQLFMSATNISFTIGSGSDVGLYIDENLAKGETNRCDTFENEPLTQTGTYFDISVVEVIAFC